MKDGRINELNMTIKSLKTKITGLENSLEKHHGKFNTFQCQSSTEIAKLQHKKELTAIKDKKRRNTKEKKKMERNCEKEVQKRKLQDAISMHHDYYGGVVGQSNKKIQERIRNSF